MNADVSRDWELGEILGPGQESDDFDNCGVYVSWVLSALVRGVGVGERSVVDPLEYRKEILCLMQRAPRHRAYPTDDGTEGESDVFLIGMTS